MDSLSETIAVVRRLHDLRQECAREADWLMEHYRAGHVEGSVFDPVSVLMSAAQRADREAQLIVTYGDENDLQRGDIIAEEIVRVLQHERAWRVALDEIHGIEREPSS